MNRSNQSNRPKGFMGMPAVWLLLALLQAVPAIVQAQINPLADQYLNNMFQMNPAIAGTERYMPLTLTTRQQWVGFSKAPTTKAISIHSRIRAKNIRFTPRGFVNKGAHSFGNVGVGGGAFDYSYGAISHTGIHLDYAYHIFIGDGRMAFGLAPVLYQFSLNKSGFIMPDGDVYDPLIDGDVNESIIFLDANVGMHYYDETSYAGLSIVQMLQSGVQFGSFSFIPEDHMNQNPDLARSIFTYYGKSFKLSPDFLLEPSVYLKYNRRYGVRFDVNALIHIMNTVSAGLTYRFREGVGLLAGVRLDNVEFRYIFEAPLTSDMPNRFTTHQVMVRFYLGQPID